MGALAKYSLEKRFSGKTRKTERSKQAEISQRDENPLGRLATAAILIGEPLGYTRRRLLRSRSSWASSRIWRSLPRFVGQQPKVGLGCVLARGLLFFCKKGGLGPIQLHEESTKAGRARPLRAGWSTRPNRVGPDPVRPNPTQPGQYIYVGFG